MAERKESKVCPGCDHEFQGNGWDGIDAHWRAKHEHIMPYGVAWPLIEAGRYKGNTPMPSKQDLAKWDITVLAVLCGAVAKNPPPDASISEEAGKLKLEALHLTAQPPQPQSEQKNINDKTVALKERMAEFLERVL
jgi:hypothetical protein